MSFKVIETQEEFDEAIKKRIEQAKRSAIEPYADYEDIKKKNADYEDQIAKLSEQLTAQAEKTSATDATIGELEARIKQYETASVKTRIAHEFGLPYELANKLSGDDEETIRADAQNLSKFVVQPAAPLGNPEPTEGDPKKIAWHGLIENLKGEE